MDHSTAISTRALERYLLDELNESQSEEFEEHYFSCEVCGGQVRSAATFLAAARPQLNRDVEPVPRPGPATPPWWRTSRALRLAASLAFAGLLGTASYQRFVTIPGLEREMLERELRGVEAGRTLPSFFLRSARGEPATVVISKGDRFVVLRLSDSLDQTFRAYRFTLRDATGATRRSDLLHPAASRTEELEVLLPTADLAAGSYVLLLEGIPAPSGTQASPATAPYPFRIERRD